MSSTCIVRMRAPLCRGVDATQPEQTGVSGGIGLSLVVLALCVAIYDQFHLSLSK